ncbi:hypothetical protein AGOR_G00121460 [Albula goreensis]|uniref:Pyrin domain-containing protein n=1 Tax=Albula goreensis TaxID=1534307 RepID=A0A8T3DAL6_9TELE|nr:hypothetical protein AGOR_G00121460 [Albula goreensis]
MADLILEILEKLRKEDFEKFKLYLNENVPEGCSPVLWEQLEEGSVAGVASLMKKYYSDKMVDLTVEILKKIQRNDLVQRLENDLEKRAEQEHRSQDENYAETGQGGGEKPVEPRDDSSKTAPEEGCVEPEMSVTEEPGRVSVKRPESPVPSCASVKSDFSMDRPIGFSGGVFPTDAGISVPRPESPVPSCVSMKSDFSMDRPIGFSGEQYRKRSRTRPVLNPHTELAGLIQEPQQEVLSPALPAHCYMESPGHQQRPHQPLHRDAVITEVPSLYFHQQNQDGENEEVLDELNLKKYNTTCEGRWRLMPAVKLCRKALLSGCVLTQKSYEIVASALQSVTSVLIELDLSNNSLGDSEVELLCAGLKSPNCKLQTLKLSDCHVTEKNCVSLASALRLNPSHLRELDLSYNQAGDSGVRVLSAVLEDPSCKLEKLKLSGCEVTERGCASLASALRSNPSHLRELDLSYNHPGDSGVRALSAVLEDPSYKLEKLNVDHEGETVFIAEMRKYACTVSITMGGTLISPAPVTITCPAE